MHFLTLCTESHRFLNVSVHSWPPHIHPGSAFILVIPGCPLCSSCRTAVLPGSGITILVPHRMHPSYVIAPNASMSTEPILNHHLGAITAGDIVELSTAGGLSWSKVRCRLLSQVNPLSVQLATQAPVEPLSSQALLAKVICSMHPHLHELLCS